MKNKKAKKTYTAYIICRNCDYGLPVLSIWGGEKTEIPKGTEIKDFKCPNCGCKELYNHPPK